MASLAVPVRLCRRFSAQKQQREQQRAALSSLWVSEERVHMRSCPLMQGRYHVTVRVQGERDAAVSQHVLDDTRVHAERQQIRGGGVPKIMGTQWGQPSGSELDAQAVIHGTGVQRTAGFRAKHQVLSGPFRTNLQPLCPLPHAMFP